MICIYTQTHFHSLLLLFLYSYISFVSSKYLYVLEVWYNIFCLLNEWLSSFIFIVITDVIGFRATILLCIFYLYQVPFHSFFLLPFVLSIFYYFIFSLIILIVTYSFTLHLLENIGIISWISGLKSNLNLCVYHFLNNGGILVYFNFIKPSLDLCMYLLLSMLLIMSVKNIQ